MIKFARRATNFVKRWDVRTLARRVANAIGQPWVFFCAVGLVVGWAALGPSMGYSENWQLFINTSTTIITFLMTFLLAMAQNRDTKATHVKLDEIIKQTPGPRNEIAGIEERDEELR